MDAITFEPAARFEALRGDRGFACRIDGLWCLGSLESLARPAVAIVGTRAATPYGRGLARHFASAFAAAGCCIISGLALGIDAAAHVGALEAGGATVGVLGGGHGHFFPRANRALAARMVAAGGAVLAPFPPEHPAFPAQFLERNAVVAALADAVVVIEAPARSGALNTAGWAAGRIPVFAVPGDVDRPHVQGCLALIRDGATLARGPQDVLEALPVAAAIGVAASGPQLPLAASPEELTPLARALLAQLAQGECGLDALVASTGADVGAVFATLARLELDGALEVRGANRYALRAGTTRPHGERRPR